MLHHTFTMNRMHWPPIASTFAPFDLLNSFWELNVSSLHSLDLPLIMFWMCEHTVRTAANSFLVPNHFSTLRVRGELIWISKDKCLKLRFKTPRGPLMVTIRDLTLASMPRGIFTHWLELMVRIFALEIHRNRQIHTKLVLRDREEFNLFECAGFLHQFQVNTSV